MTKVKIVNNSKNETPAYQTEGAAGMDLRANLEAKIELYPGKRELIPTGIHIQLPQGMEAQIRPRSGLAFKDGITVLNTPGTIDSDYSGEIKVILINNGSRMRVIENGERIAQMVIAKYERPSFELVASIEEFETTERGQLGFGSTGTK